MGEIPLNLEAPGEKQEGHELHRLQQEVAKLMQRNSRTFPGAQPVSFTRRHLEELTKKDYYLCEKSDGMRYLMYCTEDGYGQETVYLIDRRMDFWKVKELHFPIPNNRQSFHHDTIVDGELVTDTLPNGKKETKYLVFDCMFLDGINLMKRTLDKRLGYFRQQVFTPYQKLYGEFPSEIQFLPFMLDFKSQQFAYAVEMMFKQELSKLMHGNDGLIFTCRETEYHSGTDPHILKWKPESENSIDFRLSFDPEMIPPDEIDRAEGITQPYPDYDSMPTCNLFAYVGSGQPDRWYGLLTLTEIEWANLKSLNEPLNDRIVECYMDDHHRWRFMRFRDDKETGNHITTVESVIESIKDRVTEDDLIAKAPQIRVEWKRRGQERREQEKRERDKARMSINGGSGGIGGMNGNVVAGQKRAAEDQGAVRPSPGPPGAQ